MYNGFCMQACEAQTFTNIFDRQCCDKIILPFLSIFDISTVSIAKTNIKMANFISDDDFLRFENIWTHIVCICYHMPEYKSHVFYWGKPEHAPRMRKVREFCLSLCMFMIRKFTRAVLIYGVLDYCFVHCFVRQCSTNM